MNVGDGGGGGGDVPYIRPPANIDGGVVISLIRVFLQSAAVRPQTNEYR